MDLSERLPTHQKVKDQINIVVETVVPNNNNNNNEQEIDPMAPPRDMVRSLPEVPCPPYAPLPRNQLFLDIPEWPYPVVGGVGSHLTNNNNNNNNPAATAASNNHKFDQQSTTTSSSKLHVPGARGFFGLTSLAMANNNNNNNTNSPGSISNVNNNGGRPLDLASATNGTLSDCRENGPSSYLREVLEKSDPDRSNAHKYPNADRLRKHFKDGGSLAIEDALWIISVAHAILSEEENVLEIKSPVTICGDIHGQYYDLMTLFDLGGSPTPSETSTGTQYLFLGDYVDRGCFSTEVTLLLLAYKIMYPTSMWLLRGNHECRHLTGYFNFKSECLKKYTEEVYDAFMTCFDALPLAARIDNKFLCVHGGIGPDIKSVEDISLIHRVCEPPPRGPMCDLLWADPMEPDDEAAAPGARYLYNDIRSCSYSFSYKASLEFLEANGLLTLIRAHESQFEGYRMFQKVPTTGMPSVICVFSAPNYCEYNNKAAIMLLENHTMKIRQFAAVEHPYVLQNFLNAFTWSLPFLADKVQQVVGEISALSGEMTPSMEAERQKEHQKLIEHNTAMNLALHQKHGIPLHSKNSPSHATSTSKNASTRPLHGLLAAVKQHQHPNSNNNAALSLLFQIRLQSFLLLPKFLRRRGRIVKIKVKAVMYFLISLKRRRPTEEEQQQIQSKKKMENKNKKIEKAQEAKEEQEGEGKLEKRQQQQEEKKVSSDEGFSSSSTAQKHHEEDEGISSTTPTRSSNNTTDDEKNNNNNNNNATNANPSPTSAHDNNNTSKSSYPLVDSLLGDDDESSGVEGSNRSNSSCVSTTPKKVDPMEGVVSTNGDDAEH